VKAYGGVYVKIHIFLTSALVGVEWSASRPGHFNPRGKSPRYPFDRWLGGPQNQSGRLGEEKIFDPTGTHIETVREILVKDENENKSVCSFCSSFDNSGR
jgi:hypothetical protein